MQYFPECQNTHVLMYVKKLETDIFFQEQDTYDVAPALPATVSGVSNISKMFDKAAPPPTLPKAKPTQPAKPKPESTAPKTIGKINIPKNLQKTLESSKPAVPSKAKRLSYDGNGEIVKPTGNTAKKPAASVAPKPATKPPIANKSFANELAQIKLKPTNFPVKTQENGVSKPEQKPAEPALPEQEFIGDVIQGPDNVSYRKVAYKTPKFKRPAPRKPLLPRNGNLQDILRMFHVFVRLYFCVIRQKFVFLCA